MVGVFLSGCAVSRFRRPRAEAMKWWALGAGVAAGRIAGHVASFVSRVPLQPDLRARDQSLWGCHAAIVVIGQLK